MADFFERTQALEQMVGDGDLVGEFSVNRVYAAVQHERGWVNYMGQFGSKEIRRYHGGGGPKFVEGPLKQNVPDYYQHLADGVLDGTIRKRMKDNVEDQDDNLQWAAPEDDGALKRSGAYRVLDNGRVVFSKESQVPYEDEDQGDPPGFVLGFLRRGYA